MMSRISGSAMNPAFTISAKPARISFFGRASSNSRSHSTARGAWKAPTRFLPSAVLMPVFPPTAASTMPSTVVGTCTMSTPRNQVAATKPARSVVAPPPKPITASVRVKSVCPITPQQNAATSTRFAFSASGTSARYTSYRPLSCSRSASARAPRVGACTISSFAVFGDSTSGNRSSSPRPTSTSYPGLPLTGIVVTPSSAMPPPLSRSRRWGGATCRTSRRRAGCRSATWGR
jgi:hypothetical protein